MTEPRGGDGGHLRRGRLVPAERVELDTVVLLPHVASGTVETRREMERLTLRNLDEFHATFGTREGDGL